jgi:hypothetical protein
MNLPPNGMTHGQSGRLDAARKSTLWLATGIISHDRQAESSVTWLGHFATVAGMAMVPNKMPTRGPVCGSASSEDGRCQIGLEKVAIQGLDSPGAGKFHGWARISDLTPDGWEPIGQCGGWLPKSR